MSRIPVGRELGPFICITFTEYLLCTRHYTKHWRCRIELDASILSKIESLELLIV